MNSKNYYIYILANRRHTTFYVGFTGKPLTSRVYEHREKLVDGFTKRYNVDKLVYYEIYNDPISALTREKQLKGGSRQKKIDLINQMNPEWKDLYEFINK